MIASLPTLLAGCLALMEAPEPCPGLCPGNFACTEAFGCKKTCAYGGDDCADGYYCTHEHSELGDCVDACEDGECPGHFACSGNKQGDCEDFCFEDDDCASGYICCDIYTDCPDSQRHECIRGD